MPDFRASLFLLCECAAWDLPKPGGTRSAFADKQQERGNVRSILQDAQRHGQRRACWRGSRLAPSPTRRFPCLFWHVTKQATAPRHRRRTSANNVSRCPPPAARPGTPPRPWHLSDALGTLRPVTWGTLRVKRATGPRFALLPAPWGRRLPGATRVPWGRSTKTDLPRVLDPVPQPRRRFSPLCIPFGR